MLMVISGGQTGPDRAALEAAVATGMPYGGWCPKGGWAEDMPEPPGVLALYPDLRETPASAPEQRTDWNVRDSDALLVLVGEGGIDVSLGTMRAVQYAEELRKPCVVVSAMSEEASSHAFDFLSAFSAPSFGVGGPRESESPGLQAASLKLLQPIFVRMVAGA